MVHHVFKIIIFHFISLNILRYLFVFQFIRSCVRWAYSKYIYYLLKWNINCKFILIIFTLTVRSVLFSLTLHHFVSLPLLSMRKYFGNAIELSEWTSRRPLELSISVSAASTFKHRHNEWKYFLFSFFISYFFHCHPDDTDRQTFPLPLGFTSRGCWKT